MLKSVLMTFLLFASITGQSTVCRTTVGDTGSCMPLKQCTPLKNLSAKRVKTPEDIQLLRASSCGLTPDGRPKVCCPSDWDAWTPPSSVPITEPSIRPPHVVTPLTQTKPPESKPEPVPTWTSSVDCPPTAGLPSEECCGADAIGSNRIFGGNETYIDEYPWLALVEYHKELVYRDRVEKQVQTLCGGTLISSRFVLTAAHCIKISWGKPTNIRLSEYDTSTSRDCVATDGGGEECISAYIAPIQRSIIHPEYNPLEINKRNDIALFQLRSNAPYTDFIKPICLPSQDTTRFDIDTETMFYVAGWGFDGKAYSNIKMHVDVPYVPLQQCQPRYITSKKKILLNNHQLCAGGEEGKDSCVGDSGGPLMYRSLNLKFELVGIVSFGPRDCGKKGFPGVYTNVYQYIDWIKKNMEL